MNLAPDTNTPSARYRARIIDHANERVLITDFRGTLQEGDLTVPPNCGGFGRIRHFHRLGRPNWTPNPLPIDPALRALSLPRADVLRTQLFQNAACSWRCWYCFVPYNLLSANPLHSAWLSADDLLDRFLAEEDPPDVIVLSGGQPDLTPEWTVWMLRALTRRSLSRVYVWTDDNLSNDYLFRHLTAADRDILRSHARFGRVGCFKGFDESSFAFNSGAASTNFGCQFEIMRRLLTLDLDTYAYVTLTSPTSTDLMRRIESFVDRLQDVHELLPLRTIPLEITMFGTVLARPAGDHRDNALMNQYSALDAWQTVLHERFPNADDPITEVSLSAT